MSKTCLPVLHHFQHGPTLSATSYQPLVTGDPDPKAQADRTKKMTFSYQSIVGELIYPVITCRPDLAFSVCATSQQNACPHEIHFNGAKHMFKYMYVTKNDGIYFWRTTPKENLPFVEPPKINSNLRNLLLDGRPIHDALDLHGYMDGTWVSCLRLAGHMVVSVHHLLAALLATSTPYCCTLIYRIRIYGG